MANIVPIAIIMGSIRASASSGGSMLITLWTRSSLELTVVVVTDRLLVVVLAGRSVVVLVLTKSLRLFSVFSVSWKCEGEGGTILAEFDYKIWSN